MGTPVTSCTHVAGSFEIHDDTQPRRYETPETRFLGLTRIPSIRFGADKAHLRIELCFVTHNVLSDLLGALSTHVGDVRYMQPDDSNGQWVIAPLIITFDRIERLLPLHYLRS